MVAIAISVALLVAGGGSVAGETGLDGGAEIDHHVPAEIGSVGTPIIWQTDEDANETDELLPPHQNPDEIQEDGDLEGLGAFLQSDLDERLGESNVELDEGEYELARSVLGDEYDGRLEQFAEIAEDIDAEAVAESYEQAQTEQKEFTNETERYYETLEGYEEAREEGDDQRARELARELETIEENVSAIATDTISVYDLLEETTGFDQTDRKERINRTSSNVSETQTAIREAEFVRTTLAVEANRTSISFLDPVRIEGVLRNETGDPISGGLIKVGTEERPVTTRTNETGAFSVVYRPVRLPIGAEELPIGYSPEPGSEYLGNRTTVPVDVSATPGTVEIQTSPETASFGDRVPIAGQVTAGVDERAIEDLPLSIAIDGTELANTTTDESGAYAVEPQLPLEVASGPATIEVRIDQRDRAIEASSASEPIEIEPTDSRMELELPATTPVDAIPVVGTLETANGTSIQNASIELAIAETTVQTVETNATGAFEATIEAPATAADAVGDNDSTAVAVTASFDGSDTAVESTSASGTVTIEEAEAGLDLEVVLLLGGGGVVLATIALLVWYLRRDDTAAGAASEEPIATVDRSPGGSSPDRSLLSAAVDAADAGRYDRAVLLAYDAVRTRLVRRGESSPASTHWEVYREHADEIGLQKPFRRLVETYERVAFSPHGSPDESTASAAVDAARGLLESMDAEERSGGRDEDRIGGGAGDRRPVADGGSDTSQRVGE